MRSNSNGLLMFIYSFHVTIIEASEMQKAHCKWASGVT